MAQSKVSRAIERINLPYAYDHFAEGESPDPPFLIYRFPNSDSFIADGVVYYKIDVMHLELYTDKKDPALEEMIEGVLDKIPFVYQKSETWIASEKLYQVLYEMEV